MKLLSCGRTVGNDSTVGCAAGWWAVGPDMHTVGVIRTAQTPTELLLPHVKLKASSVGQRKISALSASSCH